MEPKSLTLSSDKIALRLITPIHICQPYSPDSGKPHPAVVQVNGLWDTGAVCTTITSGLAAALGLPPMGFETVFHANGSCVVKKYMVNVLLPNGIELPMLPVLEGNLHGCDMLIGMDIISKGDFVLTNRDGKTVFSFQIPSTHLYDFVKQSAAANAKAKPKKKR